MRQWGSGRDHNCRIATKILRLDPIRWHTLAPTLQGHAFIYHLTCTSKRVRHVSVSFGVGSLPTNSRTLVGWGLEPQAGLCRVVRGAGLRTAPRPAMSEFVSSERPCVSPAQGEKFKS